MKILVTGGAGFIGSHFTKMAVAGELGIVISELTVLDKLTYAGKLGNLSPLQNHLDFKFVQGDITDANIVNASTKNIDLVINFAAESHVDRSIESSHEFLNSNVIGVGVLLEACLRNGVNRYLQVSTDEVYGESMNSVDELHKTEHSVLCPTNPYAATKAGAELIAQSYCHSYKMPIIITRGNNVYGPNQYPEKLIPLFVKLLKENKKVTIQGEGASVRAFLHAYDTARAFECILEKGQLGEIYNIGCDEGMEYSVMEIAKILIKLIKNTENYEEWIEYIEDRPYNDMRYYISNSKVKALGWNIEVDFMTGIKELC